MDERKKCEACKSESLNAIQIGGHIIKNLTSNQLRVTNKDYGESIETVLCKQCTLVQPKYILNTEDIIKLYSTMDDEEYLNSSDLRGKANYKQIIKIINKLDYINTKSAFLEIGAGCGSLLNLLKKNFPSIKGLEPNTSFCKQAKNKYNLEIINSGYENLKTNDKFDCIIALDVIEHVSSPDHFMKTLRDSLTTNGIAIIGTPDIKSITARLFRKKWWHIRPPHIYYFNDKSFGTIATNNGFKISKKGFWHWELPLNYILDSIQKLVFKKTIIHFKFLNFPIHINTYDSKLYVLKISK